MVAMDHSDQAVCMLVCVGAVGLGAHRNVDNLRQRQTSAVSLSRPLGLLPSDVRVASFLLTRLLLFINVTGLPFEVFSSGPPSPAPPPVARG